MTVISNSEVSVVVYGADGGGTVAELGGLLRVLNGEAFVDAAVVAGRVWRRAGAVG